MNKAFCQGHSPHTIGIFDGHEPADPNPVFSGEHEPMRPHHLSFGANYAERKFTGAARARMCRSRSHSRQKQRRCQRISIQMGEFYSSLIEQIAQDWADCHNTFLEN